ncbi:MAG: ACP S-malonyltransferase [Gammaproteobacteria bacterium]|nr:ACP S-malonyltransferase [Gammaproteobacteria bacterium]
MSLAFVFPGQGSQSIGMMNALAEAFASVKDTFAEASSVLGYDLWQVVTAGPEEKLNSTDVTQPAMLTAGVATWRAWLAQGGAKPVMMAGHSLGEYTALVCAGALAFEDAVKLVAARGQYMQAAVPKGTGAMAAILGLDDADVIAVCNEAAQDDIVQAVNFNSPGQVVVAGNKAAVERATEIAKARGAKRAVILPVSVPSHCQLMKPAADKLAADLSQITIQAPAISVINNVDVKNPTGADAIRDALARQLYQPVRWVEVVQAMVNNGVNNIVECGPGKVLVGLNKRIDKTITHSAITDAESLSACLTTA